MGRRPWRRPLIRRGEVYWVNLDPAVGAEIRKRRPALVVSNDLNNQHSATVTVLPMSTSGLERAYPFQVKLPPGAWGNAQASKVKAEQIRTVDKSRLQGQAAGALSPEFMRKVDGALRLHLGLDGPPP